MRHGFCEGDEGQAGALDSLQRDIERCETQNMLWVQLSYVC